MSQTGFVAHLTALRGKIDDLIARVEPGACYDNQMQAESFFQFQDYIVALDEDVTDCRIALIDETRGWGNQPPMSRVDRKLLRDKTNEDREGLLADAREWADEAKRGEAA